MEEKDNIQKKKNNWLLIVIIAALSVVIVICAVFIIDYFSNSDKEKSAYDELMVSTNIIEGEDVRSPEVIEEEELADPVFDSKYNSKDGTYYYDLEFTDRYETLANKDLNKLNEKYNDMYGWIYIPGTNVNYPVMYCSGEKYLYRNFKGEDAVSGSIFVQKRNSLDPMDKNVTLHGHNMKNGTMFGSLIAYWLEDGMTEGKKVYFDTIYGRKTYMLFSSYIAPASGDQYKTSFSSDKEYVEYLNKLRNLSEISFNTDKDFSADDKIITLSTCTKMYGATDADRLIFHAYEVK